MRLNKTPPYVKLSEAARNKMEEAMPLEIKFYEYLKKRLEQQKKEL